MPIDDTMALVLRALGAGFNLPEVLALYAPLLARQSTAAVRRSDNLRYGPHERQVLDVFEPQAGGSDGDGEGKGDGPKPVLVVVHGGGFVRGDKSAKANLGWYFAGKGIVTALPNYRLAPQGQWPSGPQDVAAVVAWLREHAASFGGDPQRIVLLGESAGAAHVAAAVLMRRFEVDAAVGVRGAVLVSGPYNARLERLARAAFGVETPDPRNDAYFGSDDHAALAPASIALNIDAAPLPLLVTFAQRDLLPMQACQDPADHVLF